MKNNLFIYLVLFISIFSLSNAKAQTDTTKKAYETETIDVTGEYKGKSIIETPYSIGVLDTIELKRTNGIHLQNSLNLIPGVRMEMRTNTSGTRIVIRGYGNSTNFNGIGYKAYFNNISLTDADGTTTMDDIDFTTLGKLEVIKGPSSSLFGTGIAGVVNMQTEKAPLGTSIRQDVTAGKYGMLRTNTIIGLGTSSTNLFINYGHQSFDGYRVHSNSKKDFVTINGDYTANPKSKVSFYYNYTNTVDYLAGEMDSTSFFTNPTGGDPRYLANDAHIAIESQKAGLSYEYKFSKNFSNISSVFAGGYTLDQPYAVGLSHINKTRFGGRTLFNFSPEIGKIPVRFLFGSEFLKNINYQKTYGLTNNVQGALTADMEIKPTSYNAFAQAEVSLTPTTMFMAGASINFLEYFVKDMKPQTPTYVNASGLKKFDAVVTPRIALRQMINPYISVYASYSEGYQPPATNQVVITQLGQVNYDLKPERARSFEFGTKGNVLNHALNYELALYTMNVTDKLVPQNYPSYTLYVNAGKVRYNGLETQVSYNWWIPKSNIINLVRPFVSFTYNDFKYIDFKSDNNNNASTKDYTDKNVAGVPKTLINAGLDFESPVGLYLNSTIMYVDKVPLVNDNSSYAGCYAVVNMKLGFRKNIINNIMLDVFAGADNLNNRNYAAMYFINASDKRYYLPAADRVFYGGLSLKYLFN